MNKKKLSERDICTKFITPAVTARGWDPQTQLREEVGITNGRVIVRGKLIARGEKKFADYVLYWRPNIPIAIIEAKDNNHSVGAGMQQGLNYAEMLDVPFVFSSNGDGFLFHDRTGQSKPVERELALDEFPPPEDLWARYCRWRGIKDDAVTVVEQDYYSAGAGKEPRYYQVAAINRVVEAVARKQDRILLVMATGTGKTFTAFQIIWRLWKAGVKKRVLFLADRNILVDQTKTNDFKPFGGAMTKITKRKVDQSFEVYLALYQAISGTEPAKDIFKQFSPGFFDLVIVDECHRGSAAENSAWREILEYFSSATQIGLTATPKETVDVSTRNYFGDPVYTYSLKQGIDDGFLAPYKVVRIDIDKDVQGWRPEKGKTDKYGNAIEDRVFNQSDMDRTLVLEQRTQLVAAKVTEFLKATDRYAKTIVFCEDIEHAERMRQALVNENADLCAENRKYVMRITGDNAEGKAEQLPHLLCTTNMLFHGIEVPSNIRHDNTLARPLRDYGPKDRVDVIISNPPFGGMEEDGIENNFPAAFRTRETADLFLVLFLTLLKPGGRAGFVLPDGTLFGEGVKTRIKEKLLEEANLHTIVRLPKGVFSPYTGIKTNLLFFTKSDQTKEVWFYEHPYPPGAKSYSKTKPLRIEEFGAEKKWWEKRKESEQAWRVSITDIKARGYNLDMKNPNSADEGTGDVSTLLDDFRRATEEVDAIKNALARDLDATIASKSR